MTRLPTSAVDPRISGNSLTPDDARAFDCRSARATSKAQFYAIRDSIAGE